LRVLWEKSKLFIAKKRSVGTLKTIDILSLEKWEEFASSPFELGLAYDFNQ
jgi:hypothetical protein